MPGTNPTRPPLRRTAAPSRSVAIVATIAAALTASMGAIALADDLHLAGGDRLTGTVVERTDEHVVLDHPLLGRLVIPASEIVTSGGAESAVASAADVALAVQADEAPKKEWKSRFVFGGGASTGNSDNQNLNAMITSVRETEAMRTALDAAYFYAASDGDRSENRVTAGVLNDWLMPDSPWLFFASGRYDYDEFKSWDHRLGLHGGVGYDLFKEDDFTLTLRAGAGAIREWGGDDDGWRPEGLFGFDLGWQITERQRLEAGTFYYPDLEEFSTFRLVSYARWSVLVDEEANMSLNVGLENEYESKVDPGREHNDFRVTAGIQFDF